MNLHFNTTRTDIGEGHIVLTDRGTFWDGEIIVFNHRGEILNQFSRTFSRDTLAHQIIEELVAEYNKDLK